MCACVDISQMATNCKHASSIPSSILGERLVSGNIKYDSLDPLIQQRIGSDNKRLYDMVGAPLLHALANRSWNSDRQNVYSARDIESILGVRNDNSSKGVIPGAPTDDIHGEWWPYLDGIQDTQDDAESEAKIVPDAEENSNAVVSSAPKGVNWKKFIPVGVAGLTGLVVGALIAYTIIRNRRKKAKKRLVKKAFVRDGLARTFVPEYDLLDRALRANSKKDYKYINENIGNIINDRLIKGNVSKFIPQSGNTFTWDRAFSFPGDKSRPYTVPGELSPKIKGYNAAMAQLRVGDKKVPYGITPDLRASMITQIASSMLPIGSKGAPQYSTDPNIGNMAYDIPAVLGSYARDKNMSEEAIEKAKGKDLDTAVLEAVKHTYNKYPALKNIASAYVNGGFGDSKDPKGFGMGEPLWDYFAKAPTQEGTNMLRKVVNDIGAAGGYGGYVDHDKDGKIDVPDDINVSGQDLLPFVAKDPENGRRFIQAQRSTAPRTRYDNEMKEKHFRELLRFFDNVGPSVFTPKTILGKEMAFHPEGGLIPNAEKAWNQFIPYIELDEGLLDSIDKASGGLVTAAKNDAIAAAK